jgi:broad specificity phosphatase PhoE
MRERLILVKHSLPAVDPSAPASQWRLSVDGRQRCRALARALEPFRPADIVSSDEPKASETAQLLAAAWGQGYRTVPGLHEQRREALGWLSERDFEAGVRRFFARLDDGVFGEETGAQAIQRFTRAIAAVWPPPAGSNLIAVAHGTVIALYAMSVARVDGFELWRRLGLPSYVVIDPMAGRLEAVVERVEGADGATLG